MDQEPNGLTSVIERDHSLRERLSGVYRNAVIGVAALAISAGAVNSRSEVQAQPANARTTTEMEASPSVVNGKTLINQIGQTMINQAIPNRGGWEFRSAIQAPHFQTDRDVGAASVLKGFLDLAAYEPHDKRWINGAKKTATWLTAVSHTDGKGGRYWHDYIDGKNESNAIYTSFDDGVDGISDAFYRLYNATGIVGYKNISMQGLNWEFSHAERGTNQAGQETFQWPWNVSAPKSPHYMGMGEGQVGILNSFATFYQRLKNTDPAMAAKCKRYFVGGERNIVKVQQALANEIGDGRALPETAELHGDGGTTLNSGWLSGSAGAADMYQHASVAFGDRSYLNKANTYLGWLQDTKKGPMVRGKNGSASWKVSIDPEDTNNNHIATGGEEGNAGIIEAFLHTYQTTHNHQYLKVASQGGLWLVQNASHPRANESTWREYLNPPSASYHANLNNGVAGIDYALYDLGKATHNNTYIQAAKKGENWLNRTAIHATGPKGPVVYWHDNGGDGEANWKGIEISGHWGLAGEAYSLMRTNGGKAGTPTNQ